MDGAARRWEILLVEDNPADIRLTREALRELLIQHRLTVAEDGLAALKYLTAESDGDPGSRPDIILLDLNLPRMSGLEFLAVVKSSEQFKSIPVIVMSSSAAPEDVAAAYRLNANSYTQKPLEIDQFISVLQTIRRFWLETALLPAGLAGKPQ
jgi:two-component system, chemotaxis family, response regulator Rcp1